MTDTSRARSADEEFRRFQRTRAPDALAAVFDATAPGLLLVAMHLVRDAADAEDMVQTVFLQAIRDAGRYDAGKPVLPWLLGILEHRAHDLRQRAHRRRERGNAALAAVQAAAPAADAPDQVATGAETLALVALALEGLTYEYREVLTLRLVHGLRAIDIAHAQGASPETVRTRLRRGLALLRRMLPRSLATPALFALLAERSLRAGSGLTVVRTQVLRAVPGALAGLVVGKWLAAAGMVLLTAFLGRLAWPSLWGGVQSASLPDAAATVPAAHVDSMRDANESGNTGASAAGPSGQRTAVAPAGTDTTVLRGRVVAEESGAPLMGLVLRLETDWARDRGDPPSGWSPPPDVTTSANGAFEFRFVPPPTLWFRLRFAAERRLARGWASGLRTGVLVDLGDVALGLATPLQLVVVDEHNRPCPGLHVTLSGIHDRSTTGTTGTTSATTLDQPVTDERGIVGWPAVPPGSWTYEIDTQLAGDKLGQLVIPLQDSPFLRRLVLRRPPPELSVSGVVVDTAGAPVADLEVMIPVGFGIVPGFWGATTGPDGTFLRSVGRPLEGNLKFHLCLPEHRTDLELLDDAGEFAWGRNDLRILVRRRQPARLRVTVVDAATGEPVEEFGATCRPDRWLIRHGPPFVAAPAAAHHAGGTMDFADLAAGPYCISVFPRAPLAERGEIPVALAEGENASLRVALDRPAALTVDVVEVGSGHPVAGVDVNLARVVPERDASRATLDTCRVALAQARRGSGGSTGPNVLVLDRAPTDAQGRVVLRATPDTPALIAIVEGDRCIARLVRDVRLPRAGGAVRIEVDPAASLRGLVRPAEFVARFGPDASRLARAAVSPPDPAQFADDYPEVELRLPGARHTIAKTHVAADGSFQICAIPPGDYQVWVTAAVRYGGSRGWVSLGPVAALGLRSGDPQTIEIDAAQYLPGRVLGRFFLDGQPVQGEVGFARLDPRGAGVFPLASDAAGVARSDWLLPGRYLPCVMEQQGHNRRYLFGTEAFVLAPGAEVEITASLHRRRVAVTLRDATGQPVADRRLVLEPIDHPELSWPWRHGDRTDAHGVLVFDPAPPGRLRVRAFAPEQDPHRVEEDPPRLVVGELAGDAERLEIRLER